MGTACACAAVTGAKGEAVTFARTSTGTCTKPGLATTGIVSADLATCASGQARVERDSQGYLGLLVEEARTNSLIRSQELENFIWIAFIGTGGTSPTVTANQGTAPDPSPFSQPEQVAFAATTGAQASMLSQAAMSIAAYSSSVYAQYVSGTCNLDLCIETNATGPVATCTSTSVSSSTTWTLLKNENVTSVASGRVFIGNGSALNGASARSACTVLLWQVDAQAGAFITSPIYTAGATATRVVEVASVSVAAPGAVTLCEAASVQSEPASSTGAYQNAVRARVGAGDSFAIVLNNATNDAFGEVNETQTMLAGANPRSGTVRLLSSVDGTTLRSCVGGTCATAAQTQAPSNTAKTLYIGSNNTSTNSLNGIVSRIQYDASPTRCQ